MSVEDLILRATRAAVRDHSVRDLLTIPADGDPIGRMWEIADRRKYADTQPRRSVADALTTAQVMGAASDLTRPEFVRHPGEIVVRVTYARTYLADYAVAPGLPALCWAD